MLMSSEGIRSLLVPADLEHFPSSDTQKHTGADVGHLDCQARSANQYDHSQSMLASSFLLYLIPITLIPQSFKHFQLHLKYI